MPHVTQTANSEGIIYFLDGVAVSDTVYTYDNPQSEFTITNTGTRNIIFSAGPITNVTVTPGSSYDTGVLPSGVSSFTVRAQYGYQSFTMESVEVAVYRPTLTSLDERMTSTESSLADIAYNIKNYGAKCDGVTDDSAAIRATINAIKTAEYTEGIPTQGAKAKIILPPGRIKIASKISVPAYIDIEGSGRHTTIIDSYITNGDPVFHVISDTSNVQQFYNTLQGFTINGRDQNCQGIKIEKTSRWVLRDIMIDHTDGEGIYLQNAYLGEIYSCLIRACGDATRYSVYLTGTDANNGSHAVSFFGGEINGGTGVTNGVYLKFGTSVGFFGTTIEGFPNGIGLSNENGNSLTVQGCYFEGNKENIVETAATLGTNYVGNYLGTLEVGGRGHIGIFYAQGSKIEGNFFAGTSSKAVFDSTANTTGRLNMSSVRNNYTQSFPISVDASIISSAQVTGTIIESYDGNANLYKYGKHKFKDTVIFENDAQPQLGISNLNNKNVVLKAGTGSPEGNVVATRGLYIDESGTMGESLYFKVSGTNSAYGWKPIQTIHWSSTASRPTLTANDLGYRVYDNTLYKPVWWNGVAYKDSNNCNPDSRGINVAVSASATSLAVTFPTAETDSLYGVSVAPAWNTTYWITNKSTNGFTINFGTVPTSASTLDWSIRR